MILKMRGKNVILITRFSRACACLNQSMPKGRRGRRYEVSDRRDYIL